MGIDAGVCEGECSFLARAGRCYFFVSEQKSNQKSPLRGSAPKYPAAAHADRRALCVSAFGRARHAPSEAHAKAILVQILLSPFKENGEK